MERAGTGHKQNKVKINLIVTCCLLLVMLIALIGVVIWMEASSDNQAPGTSSPSIVAPNNGNAKELVIESVEEQENMVIVSTSYGVFKYPFAFSDIIHVNTENYDDYSQMVFTAVVNDEERSLYTLLFNKSAGIPVGTLIVDGTSYTVTALVHDLQDASTENRTTFYAAQETFNDVMMSLEENAGFRVAQ